MENDPERILGVVFWGPEEATTLHPAVGTLKPESLKWETGLAISTYFRGRIPLMVANGFFPNHIVPEGNLVSSLHLNWNSTPLMLCSLPKDEAGLQILANITWATVRAYTFDRSKDNAPSPLLTVTPNKFIGRLEYQVNMGGNKKLEEIAKEAVRLACLMKVVKPLMIGDIVCSLGSNDKFTYLLREIDENGNARVGYTDRKTGQDVEKVYPIDQLFDGNLMRSIAIEMHDTPLVKVINTSEISN